MFNSKNTFKLSIISSLLLSTSAFALEKPKSIDDMWKIIEAQQKQIEALQQTKSLPEEIPTKSPNSEVKTLERKTDILSQEVEKLRTNLSIPEEAQYKKCLRFRSRSIKGLSSWQRAFDWRLRRGELPQRSQ